MVHSVIAMLKPEVKKDNYEEFLRSNNFPFERDKNSPYSQKK